jgi:uncharacterized membrane protein
MSSPLKPTIKTEIIPIITLIITIISSFYFFSNFPDQIPIHWNFQGEVDNWGSKTFGAFFFPVLILGMYLIFLILPYIDPKKLRYDQFQKTYHKFKRTLIIFMALIYFVSSFAGLGYNVNIGIWMPILIGLLFIFIGNYLSKIKPNWFLGIRTPWTLSSETVWQKTHQVGGKLFILAGVAIMIIPFTPITLQGWLLGLIVSIVIFGTVFYSLYLYLQEKK